MVAKRKLSNKVVELPTTPALKTRPLDTEEKERMEASKREYTLTEEERLSIIAKYGPPIAPLGSHHSMILPVRKKKGGGAA